MENNFTPEQLAMILDPERDGTSGPIYSEAAACWKFPEKTWLKDRLSELRRERRSFTEER